MAAGLYNFGIWQDRTLVAFVLKPSAAANAMWHELVRTKQLQPDEAGGCSHKPLTRVSDPYSQVLMCVLHGVMCIGRIFANQVHALCVCQDPALVVEVQRILREYKTGITPKGNAEPDGDESWRLLVTWNKLSGVLFIDNAMDGARTDCAVPDMARFQRP